MPVINVPNNSTINISDIRSDGRLPHEMRRISISHHIKHSTVFVDFSQGNTSVTASLGTPSDSVRISFNLKFLNTTRTAPISDRNLFLISTKLSEVFIPILASDLPLSVNILINQDDGSLFPALVNAISICFSLSSVPLHNICSAVDLNTSFDLLSSEYIDKYVITVVCLRHSCDILYFESTGACQYSQLSLALKNAQTCCQSIFSCIESYLHNLAN